MPAEIATAAVSSLFGGGGLFGGKPTAPKTAKSLSSRQVTFGGITSGSGTITSSITADQKAALDGAIEGAGQNASPLEITEPTSLLWIVAAALAAYLILKK